MEVKKKSILEENIVDKVGSQTTYFFNSTNKATSGKVLSLVFLLQQERKPLLIIQRVLKGEKD